MIKTLYPINVEKSIQRKEVAYKVTFGLAFDYLFLLLVIGSTLFFAFVISIGVTNELPLNVSMLIIISVLIIISLWLFANVYFMNALVSTKGGYAANNKVDLHRLINKKFKRLSKTFDNGTLISYYREPRFFGFSLLITCIFEDKDVYLNISSLGKGDGFLPFAGLYNYFKARKLLQSLNE